MGRPATSKGSRIVPKPGRQMQTARGFSLVEVLLALLILAIGLLGLGAAIPAVVSQQRSASDELQGIAAAKSAAADLLSRRDLNRLDPPPTGSFAVAADGQGFGTWIRDDDWSDDFMYEDPTEEYDLATGEWIIGDSIDWQVIIPVAQRLWPRPGSIGQPRFVWDLIARRVPASNQASFGDLYRPTDPTLSAPQIELVLFLRRIDPGVRVPAGTTLFQIVTGLGVPAAQARVPVGVAEDGVPTLNGEGDYSVPLRLNVTFEVFAGRRDLLLLEDSPDLDEAIAHTLASKPGQMIADNLGNVYTVLGPARDEGIQDLPLNQPSVLIRPPVPAGVPAQGEGNADWQELRQIVFTPQTPAAVQVKRVTVTNPPEGM